MGISARGEVAVHDNVSIYVSVTHDISNVRCICALSTCAEGENVTLVSLFKDRLSVERL